MFELPRVLMMAALVDLRLIGKSYYGHYTRKELQAANDHVVADTLWWTGCYREAVGAAENSDKAEAVRDYLYAQMSACGYR